MDVLLTAIGLAFFLVTLPGTVELFLLTFPGLLPARKSNLAEAGDTSITVVIPAHNEEQGIADTLQSLLACDHPLPAEQLHVIADNCTDATAEIARSLGCTVLTRVNDELRGKGYALNFAFSQLLDQGYDGLIVVDADTRVEPNFLDCYRRLFARGADAGQSGYRVANPEAGLRPRLMHIAFLAFNYLRPMSRRNLGFSCGILGNGFGLSADTLRDIPYDSFSIVEDLEYHTRLVRAGRKVTFLPETCVWSDMPVTSQEAQSQRERWEGGRFRMVMDQVPRLASDVLKGQFRQLEPLLELLLMPLTFHILLLLFLLILGKGWLMGYALIALVLVVLHVVLAMVAGKASLADWKALLTAPFYMLWKVVNLSKIVNAAKKSTGWKRTSR